MLFSRWKAARSAAVAPLPGRADPIRTAERHYVFDRPLQEGYPEGTARAMFGLGCFWGAERKFWQLGDGIWITAVGYAGGETPNAIYEEVCTGRTGHNEVVLIVYQPGTISYGRLLKTFWEGHDPTQGMRQGNDFGTQYRSGIYVFDEDQRTLAETSREAYQRAISARGFGRITTEIVPAPAFYFAEGEHQQYLAKVPHGHCGGGGTGVRCPSPTRG